MNRRRLRWLLAAWTVGVVLPLRSFRAYSPTFRAVFDWVFQTHAATITMHAFLYAVLGAILFGVVRRPAREDRHAIGAAWLAAACVAVVQEGLQLWCKGVRPGADEAFDCAVNLAGALAGILAAFATARLAPKRQ